VNEDYPVLTDPKKDRNRDVPWGDMWRHALARMVVAAQVHGLRPIDGPFGYFSDACDYRAEANGLPFWAVKANWPSTQAKRRLTMQW